ATEAAARGVTRGSARLAWDEPGLPYLFEQVTREVDRSAMSRAIHAEPVLGPVFSPADYF
ncbi:MAG: hypothetical protein HOY71_10625, partial [Nonomuraea sp.]|nr:hypothetical protein [Nonomuraea sp.]